MARVWPDAKESAELRFSAVTATVTAAEKALQAKILSEQQNESYRFNAKHTNLKRYAEVRAQLDIIHDIERKGMAADDYVEETINQIEEEIIKEYLVCRKKYSELRSIRKQLKEITPKAIVKTKLNEEAYQLNFKTRELKIKEILGISVSINLTEENIKHIFNSLEASINAGKVSLILCVLISRDVNEIQRLNNQLGEDNVKKIKDYTADKENNLEELNTLYSVRSGFSSLFSLFDETIETLKNPRGCCTIL